MTEPSAFELSGFPLLSALAPADLEAAARHFVLRSHSAGTLLATEGETPRVFTLILAGRAKFFWRDADGRQLDLAVLSPGDHFADLTFGGAPVLASVIAVEDMRVACIAMADFEALLLRHPPLCVAFLKDVIARARRLTLATRGFSMDDVYGRVSALLRARAVDVGGQLRTDRLTQADIAQAVGATREMVGRIMRDLVRGGYVSVDAGRVTLLRPLPRRW